jgi:hypothetical protein
MGVVAFGSGLQLGQRVAARTMPKGCCCWNQAEILLLELGCSPAVGIGSGCYWNWAGSTRARCVQLKMG